MREEWAFGERGVGKEGKETRVSVREREMKIDERKPRERGKRVLS